MCRPLIGHTGDGPGQLVVARGRVDSGGERTGPGWPRTHAVPHGQLPPLQGHGQRPPGSTSLLRLACNGDCLILILSPKPRVPHYPDSEVPPSCVPFSVSSLTSPELYLQFSWECLSPSLLSKSKATAAREPN